MLHSTSVLIAFTIGRVRGMARNTSLSTLSGALLATKVNVNF